MSEMNQLLRIRQLRALAAYRFVSRLYFYLPVLVVILLKQGLSLPQASIVVAVHGVAIMLLKGPLDTPPLKRISPTIRLVTGEIVKAAGVAGLAFATLETPGNLAVLIVSQALNGLGFALTAGTDSGMLHEILRVNGAQEQYRDVETRTQSYGFIAFLVSGVIGGFLATESISTPLLLTIPTSILAAACAFGLRVTHAGGYSPSADGAPSGETRTSRRDARRIYLRASWALIVFYALSRGIILTLFVWFVPVALFVTLHVPLTFFGLILGLYTGTGFVAARYSKQIAQKVGETRLLVAGVPICLTAGILLVMLDLPGLYVVIPVIIGFAAAFVRPLSYAAIAARDPIHRSEVISAAETLLGVVNAVLVLLSALLMETWKLAPSLMLLGLVGVAVAAVGFGSRNRKASTVAIG